MISGYGDVELLRIKCGRLMSCGIRNWVFLCACGNTYILLYIYHKSGQETGWFLLLLQYIVRAVGLESTSREGQELNYFSNLGLSHWDSKDHLCSVCNLLSMNIFGLAIIPEG